MLIFFKRVPLTILADFVFFIEETHVLIVYSGVGATLNHGRLNQWCTLPGKESGLGDYGFYIDGSQDTSFRRLYLLPPQLKVTPTLVQFRYKRSNCYEQARSKKISNSSSSRLDIINQDAAGIDIGAKIHYVCVPEGRDNLRIQSFGCFTEDIHAMAAWLKKCDVKSIAMESTGVYWIPVFQILAQEGFEVNLINAQHVKGVPGRKKTDVEDCAWLQKLHSYGLLQASFRPNDQTCVLRSYIRHRARLIENASTHVLRMQKALTEMNIQLHNMISDITGVTGMAIIKAILDGERDSAKLATLRDGRIRSSEAVIAKSLNGNYREEQLFILKQEFESYNFYQNQLEILDKVIEDYYLTFEKKDHKNDKQEHKDNEEENKKQLKKKKKRKSSNASQFNLRESLDAITGVDFTDIPGLSELTVQTIIAETGLDMSKWPTEKHFTSWLGLSPSNRISGGKVLSSRTKKVRNSAANAFRMATNAAGKTQTAIDAFTAYKKVKQEHPKQLQQQRGKYIVYFIGVKGSSCSRLRTEAARPSMPLRKSTIKGTHATFLNEDATSLTDTMNRFLFQNRQT